MIEEGMIDKASIGAEEAERLFQRIVKEYGRKEARRVFKAATRRLDRYMLLRGLICFFFSSRRRHTRFDCDWSSDVCSSDLTTAPSCVGDRTRRDSLRARWQFHTRRRQRRSRCPPARRARK